MPDTTSMPDTDSAAAGSAIETNPLALREALRSTILFAELGDEEVDRIAAAGAVRSLQRNVVLFAEGAEPHEFYLVLAGRIAIAQESEERAGVATGPDGSR